MTFRKLSESDKQTILDLYRQPSETTATLAGRYGVSNSTISRILKSGLSEDEYESLIQQKRVLRIAGESIPAQEAQEPEEPEEPIVEIAPEEPEPVILDREVNREVDRQLEIAIVSLEDVASPSGRRSRKRSSVAAPPILRSLADVQPDLSLPAEPEAVIAFLDEPIAIDPSGSYTAEASAVAELLGEDLLDREDDLTDLEDDDLDQEDDLTDLEDDDLDQDDDDLDGDDLESGTLLVGNQFQGKVFIQVLPLEDAPLPKTCYLVVDRSAELVARPLREFGDLGQLPDAEVQEKTLPVFDNHRIAKRFSNPRTQRVIKLPDSKVLQKTTSHLQAKGITRLLIDGQVYSL
jgi:transposase-like protein